MIIGVIGKLTRFEELKQTLPKDCEIRHKGFSSPAEIGECDIYFDLDFEIHQDKIATYCKTEGTHFFLSAANLEMAAAAYYHQCKLTDRIYGMNCIPGFINRNIKEISIHHESQKEQVKSVTAQLGWETVLVKDRVGMVTPRIVFMIINEAYFTLQEGTASKEDINTGMKLGTNYPYGPFEWCEKIGVDIVVDTLEKIYEDTKDERYKLCPLLRTERYLIDN